MDVRESRHQAEHRDGGAHGEGRQCEHDHHSGELAEGHDGRRVEKESAIDALEQRKPWEERETGEPHDDLERSVDAERSAQ